MKSLVGFTLGCLLAFLFVGIAPLSAQDAAANDLIITGVVKNKDSRKQLENVNVSVVGTNIGTVTNADGAFLLKVATTEALKGLEISHIGYLNTRLSLEEIEKPNEMTVWMVPAPNLLHEVVVYGNPRAIVEQAISKIPVNYAEGSNMLTAFYRETMQKGRRYISISEAVTNIYKTAYDDRSVGRDKTRLLKGRRLLSSKQRDTLAVKVEGGPNLALYLDIVKNDDALLSKDNLDFYEFSMEESVILDNRMQYVVSFRPRVSLPYALFVGKLYIDRERLSFTCAELGLDMTSRDKVVEAILQQKPFGLRFKPQEVSYLITYKQQDEKTYLNYVRSITRFKCDWKKRLFSSSYTIFSEMVITDRDNHPVAAIPNKEAFKQKQIFNDLVEEYWNEDFWKNYNIIEPTESLENAVDKLKKQSR